MYRGFKPIHGPNGDLLASPRLPEVEARLRVITRLYSDYRWSITDISTYLNLSRATVGRRIKELQLSRSKSESIRLAWNDGNLEHCRSTKTRKTTR